MIAAVILTLVPVATPNDFEVKSREVKWDELTSQFDLRWTFPDKRRSAGRDLVVEMSNLAALRFEVNDSKGRELRCFGDLLRVARSLDLKARQAWFKDLQRRAPRLMSDWGRGFAELLFAERLTSRRWDPEEGHSQDGILFAEGWDLSKERRAPWTELGVKPRAEQAATLIHADLQAIKDIESDYRHYPSNVGASYEAIYPMARSYLRGVDPGDKPFSFLKIYFRCDLPFPFTDYSCKLKILNRAGADGRLVTHIYSQSDDFHWMAGRDVFEPIYSSGGEWVAYLVVRQFGFDLDGVPDSDEHRRTALRGSLGNLRRKSEALFRQRKSVATDLVLPESRVLGSH